MIFNVVVVGEGLVNLVDCKVNDDDFEEIVKSMILNEREHIG